MPLTTAEMETVQYELPWWLIALILIGSCLVYGLVMLIILIGKRNRKD